MDLIMQLMDAADEPYEAETEGETDAEEHVDADEEHDDLGDELYVAEELNDIGEN